MRMALVKLHARYGLVAIKAKDKLESSLTTNGMRAYEGHAMWTPSWYREKRRDSIVRRSHFFRRTREAVVFVTWLFLLPLCQYASSNVFALLSSPSAHIFQRFHAEHASSA